MPTEPVYNALPDDFEGEQERRTDFTSPAEKLAYDADNLIALAQRASVEGCEEVLPESLIKREDDDVAGLQEMIAIRLKIGPAYEAFVDGLDLSEGAREKLKAMLTIEEYSSAVETARELGATTVPSREQIAAELMTWSVEKLRDLCEISEKPTLLIVSDSGFDDQIAAMDAHKHYENSVGKQVDAYVNRYPVKDSPYVGTAKPKRGRVSITDGVVHGKQLDGVSPKARERRGHLTEKFTTKGMRHIDGVEQATLFQKSMREAQAAKDNNLIVDNWERGEITSTFINPDSLTESALVACAYFFSRDRQVSFVAGDPERGNDFFRGRATVQVMEF